MPKHIDISEVYFLLMAMVLGQPVKTLPQTSKLDLVGFNTLDMNGDMKRVYIYILLGVFRIRYGTLFSGLLHRKRPSLILRGR